MIERAEQILYLNNKKSIDRMIKHGLDPRLPPSLGGYGIFGPKQDINKVTHRHLRVCTFLARFWHERLIIYMKKLRKITSRTRVKRKGKKPKNLLEDHKGENVVNYRWAKDLLFRYAGFAHFLFEETSTEIVSDLTVTSEVVPFVNLYYDEIKRVLSGQLAGATSACRLPFKDIDIQMIKDQLAIDPRQAKVDSMMYVHLLKLEYYGKDLTDELSRRRGMGIWGDKLSNTLKTKPIREWLITQSIADEDPIYPPDGDFWEKLDLPKKRNIEREVAESVEGAIMPMIKQIVSSSIRKEEARRHFNTRLEKKFYKSYGTTNVPQYLYILKATNEPLAYDLVKRRMHGVNSQYLWNAGILKSVVDLDSFICRFYNIDRELYSTIPEEIQKVFTSIPMFRSEKRINTFGQFESLYIRNRMVWSPSVNGEYRLL
jgi:hypothetical protein